jgi:class 3 adenylate cyclase
MARKARQGATMDIGGWLRNLGLGKYEAAFRDNEIDGTVLPSLTHENLKELGVSALGHRLKLLDAITALRNLESAKSPSVDVSTASTTSAHPKDRAERRQVTVMFSDLVGSTALSARMDPEDCEKLSPPIRNPSLRPWTASGASLRSTWATGCWCISGYPQAHEDDAERAVRAGLSLVAAVSRPSLGCTATGISGRALRGDAGGRPDRTRRTRRGA